MPLRHPLPNLDAAADPLGLNRNSRLNLLKREAGRERRRGPQALQNFEALSRASSIKQIRFSPLFESHRRRVRMHPNRMRISALF